MSKPLQTISPSVGLSDRAVRKASGWRLDSGVIPNSINNAWDRRAFSERKESAGLREAIGDVGRGGDQAVLSRYHEARSAAAPGGLEQNHRRPEFLGHSRNGRMVLDRGIGLCIRVLNGDARGGAARSSLYIFGSAGLRRAEDRARQHNNHNGRQEPDEHASHSRNSVLKLRDLRISGSSC